MSITGKSVARVLLPFVAMALFAVTGAAQAGLLVSSDFFDVVEEYNPTTGAHIAPLASSVSGTGQLGIKLNSAGTRMLVGHFGGGVDEFDAITGAYIKTFNPGGGTQWAGLYAPTGGVYIGSWNTNDIREYDAVTGAFIRVVTPVSGPSDMRIGPNGHLYICGYGLGFVMEVDAITGAFINQWSQPPLSRTNDIEFLPSGEMLVTAMGPNKVFRYDSSYNLIGAFNGTGWGRPHGIEISPFDGNIYAVDGITSQVHVFDPVTFNEINSSFLSPAPGAKITDLVFRIPEPATLAMLIPALVLLRRRSRR